MTCGEDSSAPLGASDTQFGDIAKGSMAVL